MLLYLYLDFFYDFKLKNKNGIEKEKIFLKKMPDFGSKDLEEFKINSKTLINNYKKLNINFFDEKRFNNNLSVIEITIDGNIESDSFIFDIISSLKRTFPGFLKIKSLNLKKIQKKNICVSVLLDGFL